MKMERTMMPTRRVSRHRRTAEVVPSARIARGNTTMTKAMPTMSGRHRRRKAGIFLLSRKRELSKKRKTSRTDLSYSHARSYPQSLLRMNGGTGDFTLPILIVLSFGRHLEETWIVQIFGGRCTMHGLLQRAELIRLQPLRERS
jgi:hypothetical protein